MNFCSHCGSQRLAFRIPDGDNLPRHVCAECGTVHYQNPKIVVGCLPEWEGQVLLCRRAIEPRHGLWTLPAGFLENGESVTAGALRETLEEAGARVEIDGLYTLISLASIGQVYMMFRARLADVEFAAGPESLEVKLFREDDIPWEDLAFRTIARTLRTFFLDRKAGAFPLHVSGLERKTPRGPRGAGGFRNLTVETPP
jgi:ADP-ribose pyrophosphatase YjhB (NUDIX family)